MAYKRVPGAGLMNPVSTQTLQTNPKTQQSAATPVISTQPAQPQTTFDPSIATKITSLESKIDLLQTVIEQLAQSVEKLIVTPVAEPMQQEPIEQPQQQEDGVSDNEVKALCDEVCEELGCYSNHFMVEYVLTQFKRDLNLRASIKEYFKFHQVKADLLRQIGIRRPTAEEKSRANDLTKEIFDKRISFEEAVAKWSKSDEVNGEEESEERKTILEIAKNAGYTAEIAGSEENFEEDIRTFASQLFSKMQEGGIDVDDLKKEASHYFSGMVENYKSIKESENS